MNYIQFISFGIIGMLFLSMLFSVILAVKGFERKFNIYFAIVVLTVIIYNGANTIAVADELLTIKEYVIIEKLTNIVLLLSALVYLKLISHMSGFQLKYFFNILFVLALMLLFLNHLLPNGMVVGEIISIEKTITPWSEKINTVTITTSYYAYIVYFYICGILFYMVRASIFAFKNQRRVEGYLIIGSLLPPVVIIMIVSILIDQNLVSPFLGYLFNGLGFLSLILVLGYQSVKEVLNSADRRKELQEKEDKYRLLFDTANDAIFLILNGRFVDCNYVALELYRCSREDIINAKVLTFSPEFQYDGESSKDKSLKRYHDLMNGNSQIFSWTQKRLDGTFFEAEVQLNKMVMNNDIYIQAVVRDITERIEAENILRASEEKYRALAENLEDEVNARTFDLLETNKQLESFSNSVSLDLRTPLRAIDSFSRMILEEEYSQLSEEGKNRFEIIRNNTAKMSVMIDDLLSFARTSRVEIKKISIDVTILIKKVLEELLKDEANRKIEVTVEELPKISGDLLLIRQIFVNIIGNAIKFTRNNEISKIHISGSETFFETVITIQDNGCGFDMKYSNKLFGVFQRLHSEQEYEGTGVGLAIVRRIVQRHGGTVSAYSEPGNGACFTITIPKLKL